MKTEQKHTPGSLPYFIDVYGHIYRWEKVEGGEKSVPVANWQGSGSAKESIALIDQANAADALRVEVERLREALAGVTRILEAFSYTTQLGKTQRARLEAARAALGAAE